MVRIIRSDGTERDRSSRRMRRRSSRRTAHDARRILVPILSESDIEILPRLRAAGAIPCPLFQTHVRTLEESNKDLDAAYCQQIGADEIDIAMRSLKVAAVLIVHLPNELRAHIEVLRAAGRIHVIAEEDPLNRAASSSPSKSGDR